MLLLHICSNSSVVVCVHAFAFASSLSGIRRGSVLIQGMVGSINCIAAHPLLPRLVVLCDSGDIHIWDYDLKVEHVLVVVLSSMPRATN